MSSIILRKTPIEFSTVEQLYEIKGVKKFSEHKDFVSFAFAKNIPADKVYLIALYQNIKDTWFIGEVKDYTPKIDWQIQ